MRYRLTREAVFSVKYHVIWCPKYRRRVLGGAAELRLTQIIGEVVAGFGGMVIEVETMHDHVHLLVELPPQVAVSKLVKILKGRSSRRLRQEFSHLARMKCLWAPSYFVSTVGGAPLEVVRRYVENQELADARKRAKTG
jgi:putative transposase